MSSRWASGLNSAIQRKVRSVSGRHMMGVAKNMICSTLPTICGKSRNRVQKTATGISIRKTVTPNSTSPGIASRYANDQAGLDHRISTATRTALCANPTRRMPIR